MAAGLDFHPLLPAPLLWGLGGLALALVLLAAWRGGPGWWLRAAAFAVLLAALWGPSLREELRDPLADVAFLVIDESLSQTLEDRAEVTARSAAAIEARLRALARPRPGGTPLETRIVRLRPRAGAAEDPGTALMTALAEAAAEVDPARIAGAIVISDGQIHDMQALPAFPAPVHLLLTGRADEWDRRLAVEAAPAFGIVGEEVVLRLRIDALGRTPPGQAPVATLRIAVDGAPHAELTVPLGRTVELPIAIAHGGANIVELVTPALEGELTGRNNTALVTINGVRDRLRVLLVSGEPHPGERTWRNLLKADPSVDLVHFTILRPPEKQDNVPVHELSLIAFPTRELFMEKIDEFDLIIFDRYRRRGVLPRSYLANIARYVQDGGAVLVAAGPDYAGIDSLHRTPIRDILPAEPTGRVIEEGFRPLVSGPGFRHPVTEALEGMGPEDGSAPPQWGRWFRLIELVATSGQVLMTGAGDRPLLVLDRPGAGRVAMLASDHVWLWSRGFEGGGPQSELLRRLAHWLMKEPELEEEALVATARGALVEITRRSLAPVSGRVSVTAPGGATRIVTLEELRPGRWTGSFTAEEPGLWRIADETRQTVVAVGPAAPREFADPVSTPAVMAPLVEATLGGILRLSEAGLPEIRRVAEDRRAAGRGWIGLAERRAHAVRDIRLTPVAPGWLMLLIASALVLVAWRIEGR
ncbi:MAG: hypothetical protein D6686_03385 [Alphaproteobacteria bacterium]|nr:MAG: hypothetical protein D6686_03385 [Alphaproteobacteria bacterium]